MAVLHMDTEQVRGCCRKVLQLSERIADHSSTLQTSVQALDANWMGNSATEFLAEIRPLLQRLETISVDASGFNTRLNAEIDEWLKVDAVFGENGSSAAVSSGVVAGISAPGIFAGGLSGFGLNSTSLSEQDPRFDNVNNQDVAKRGSYTRIDGVLFNPGADGQAVHISDIAQGRLRDCYFLAGIGAIAAQNPGFIESMIRDNGDGTYTVTFWQKKRGLDFWNVEKEKVEITVDNDFPALNNHPAFTQPGDGLEDQKELWPMIVEKAYAQMEGGYANIEGGNSRFSMELLTGQNSQTHLSLTIDDLARYHREGYGMTVGTHEWIDFLDFIGVTDSELYGDGNDVGGPLVPDHEYYIVDVDEANNSVTLANPWGLRHGEIEIPFDQYNKAFFYTNVNPITPS